MGHATREAELRKISRVGLLVGLAFVLLTVPVPFLLTAPSTEIEHRIVDYLLLWSIAVPSFVAFFGLYRVRGDIRDAIAGGFVISFFCILFLAVELNIGNFGATAGSIRQLALSNFMTLVGTIVVFYFGSEAAIRVGDAYVKGRAERIAAPKQPEGASPAEGHDRQAVEDV